MRHIKLILTVLAVASWMIPAEAYINPGAEKKNSTSTSTRLESRANDCTTATEQIDMNINNVRARLTTGGDVWWDRNDGKYIVPNVEPGQVEVSSIFAASVWLAGFDPEGNIKAAAQRYGNASGNNDYFAGPLDPETGTTNKETCDLWDRFWTVTSEEVNLHLANFLEAEEAGVPYLSENIPAGVRGWPARGNDENFFFLNNFELPDTDQGLGAFFDRNEDGLYQPELGEYPIIEIRGCEAGVNIDPRDLVPDQMMFWIFNDAGNIHTETVDSDPIQMEVQVQAFAYATNDEINNMTFQRYKLINRATDDIEDMYFGWWVDADLGCYLDDYIGCNNDTVCITRPDGSLECKARSLMYTYNADALDGQPGVVCAGVPTYGSSVPIIGIDYFRGPLDENRNELGMSNFTYFNNPAFNNPPTQTTDPDNAREVYNYLSGFWKDGTPFTFGGSGYNPTGTPVEYVFPDDPDDENGWSMCSADLPEYDRRTVQSTGPFKLENSVVNELIIGAVWVPDMDYPCPNISRLLRADDVAQSLFDNCFNIIDGPDAPTVDWIELDQQVIAVLTNVGTSNNLNEEYSEPNLFSPGEEYEFEGYKLYQLAGPNVSINFESLNDPTLARLIAAVDVKNDVSVIYNHNAIQNTDTATTAPAFLYIPQLMVEGANEGIRHTFPITTSRFGNRTGGLVNHTDYYFTALAYGQSLFELFNPYDESGSQFPYIEGRRNVEIYEVTPRPITDMKLNANYGEGPVVTRLAGEGVGGNFVDMSDATRESIIDGSFNGEIVYKEGLGPISVQVYNPLEVVNGEYELTFVDPSTLRNDGNDELDTETHWVLRELSNPDSPILSEKSILSLNEQILAEFGFTIAIGQGVEPGESPNEGTNGAIGITTEYANPTAVEWFRTVPNGGGAAVADFPFAGAAINFTCNFSGGACEELDPEQHLTTMGNEEFLPFQLTSFGQAQNGFGFYITPGWRQFGNLIQGDSAKLTRLNNVDVVFTSNKDLWSRCVVVETATDYYIQAGAETEGLHNQFDLRGAPSVGKDADADGFPVPDGDGEGMGWFPGYAIDVETGERLNIFFGENSAYDEIFQALYVADGFSTGRDMMYNPSGQPFIFTNGVVPTSILDAYLGGQHFVYVTDEPYDECAAIRTRLEAGQIFSRKVSALNKVTWAGVTMSSGLNDMLSYAEGLIPNDLTIKLRVDNRYKPAEGTGVNSGYPTYRFQFDGVAPEALTQEGIDDALAAISVVPNPYYAFSEYERSQFDNTVKITNLPAKCVVTIFTLDGKFVRRYDRDEIGAPAAGSGLRTAQVLPNLEWDLKNSAAIPISSGVYLIHVDAPGLGERTLKWFGVNRQFDPTGL